MIIYARSLTFDSQLCYCSSSLPLFSPSLYFTLFRSSFPAGGGLSLSSSSSSASTSFSSTSGQPAVAGHGSFGWEGVEGRGGGRVRGFEETINCKAQGTVKEKKIFDTECAL